MLVAPGPLVTMATPGRPVTWAYPSAMWPAPCSWRTRMCRIDESRIGSYTGRMAPPGRPNITSTCCISKLLIRACAPVSSIGCSLVFCVVLLVVVLGWVVLLLSWARRSVPGHENDLPSGRSESAHGEKASCALRNEYQDAEVGRAGVHSGSIVARSAGRGQVPRARNGRASDPSLCGMWKHRRHGQRRPAGPPTRACGLPGPPPGDRAAEPRRSLLLHPGPARLRQRLDRRAPRPRLSPPVVRRRTRGTRGPGAGHTAHVLPSPLRGPPGLGRRPPRRRDRLGGGGGPLRGRLPGRGPPSAPH